MIQKILFCFSACVLILLILFLNGDIGIPGKALPAFGKFLNPFGGVWSSNTLQEKTSLTLTAKGLKAPVEIIYDERRVAHIYADNLSDALFAQGYAETQNRLFQMEFLTMAATGCLSSIFGAVTKDFDLEKRRRGMLFAAENAAKTWSEQEDTTAFSAYIAGANAYIAQLEPKDYPIEFKLFNIKPSPWSILKSALVFKQMSLTLAGRNDDIEMTNLRYSLGKQDFEDLYPEKQTIENPVIPTEKPYDFVPIKIDGQSDSAYFDHPVLLSYFENRDKGIGSNSWAVSGSKTVSGQPIFCNDPHLSLSLPSIWFEVHIHTPTFNAYGVSFPGFPGIMIGFNEFIAWGETNVGQDVEDLFIIRWANKEKTKYFLDDKILDVTYRLEEVYIKGGKTIVDTVKYTYWGPIYKTSADGKHDIAMRWLCHDKTDTDEFNVFIEALTCKNYTEYLNATQNYISPAQNFGFASVDGDIALRVNGRFPAKKAPDGRFLEWGDKSKHNWEQWIPKAQNPQIINPKRGFISSANQVSADKTYPYYFTGKFERYRNRSVNDKLEKMSAIDVDGMKKMQFDDFSQKAADFTLMIIKMIQPEELTSVELKYLESLKKWDFTYKGSSTPPTLFEIFYRQLSNNTWDEIITLGKTMDITLPEDWRLLELIEQKPDHRYFDDISTPVKENASDMVLKSFKDAVTEMEKLEKEGKDTNWQTYKPLHIYHMTRIPAFSEMDIPTNGCTDAINAVGNAYGPSWRMVVSLEKKIKAFAVYPGGQSGHPASKFYKNMISTWAKGAYFDLDYTSSAETLKKRHTQIIQLSPAK